MARFRMTFDDDNTMDINMEEGNDLNVDVFENAQWIDPQKHNDMVGRDEANAHPISAISELQARLDSIQSHIENSEIHTNTSEKESWNNKSRVYRNASGALVISI